MAPKEISRWELEERLAILISGNSSDASRQDAVRYFRKMLSSSRNTPSSTFLEFMAASSLINALVACLTDWDHPQLQLDAAWSLTNIVCGDEWETHAVVCAGAVDKLCALAKQQWNLELRDQAIWAMSNIAGDCSNCRQILLSSEFLPLLAYTLEREVRAYGHGHFKEQKTFSHPKSSEIDSLKTVVWAVSNMCRGRPALPFVQMRMFVPMLTWIINDLLDPKDTEILIDACWSLAYLADGTHEEVAEIVVENPDLCPRLVGLLYRSDTRLVGGALRTLGNIVTGNDSETQTVVDTGIVPALLHLIEGRTKESLQREAVWTLSNVTAGTVQQIQSVIDNEELLAHVIRFLFEGEKKTQKEAVWAVCNAATGGTEEQACRLIEFGAIPALCSAWEKQVERRSVLAIISGLAALLRSAQTDSVRALCTIVEMYGGKDSLEKILRSTWNSGDLEQRAEELYHRYFTHDSRISKTEVEEFIEFQFYPKEQ